MRKVGTALLLLLAAVAVCLAAWGPEAPRATIYAFLRQERRARTLADLPGYKRLNGEHLSVFYSPRDAGVAPVVLEAAERGYPEVVRRLGYAAPLPVPIVLRPDRASLQRAFGWSNSESALGVYQSGIIQVLSPNVWLQGANGAAQRQAFMHLNPLSHEMTHYLLDYVTQGNYPRWFTEGLAQRIEYQVTGYLWLDAAASLRQPLYSLQDLNDRFDDLTNQALAYRESYLLVDYIVGQWGEAGLHRLVAGLAAHHSFDIALQDATGMAPPAFEKAWQQWAAANAERLDAQLAP